MHQSRLPEKLEKILKTPTIEHLNSQKYRIQTINKKKTRRFILFGCGALGLLTLRRLRESGVEPLVFVDNNQYLWWKEVDGLIVEPPRNAFEKYRDTALFIISIYNNSSIIQQLERNEINYMTFAELGWEYPEALLPHCAVELPHKIYNQSNDIRRAFSLMMDDRSKDEFLAQIEWRTSLNRHWTIAHSDPNSIYFDSELINLGSYNVIVDCGAFDGDTIREISQRSIQFSKLIAIEPDVINFHKLQEYLLSLDDDTRIRITSLNIAIDKESGITGFETRGNATSGIKNNNQNNIFKKSLDDILTNIAPTFIKMDIEGAEYDALLGARTIIREHLPTLAISLYHIAEDLWRIPLLIREISDRYNIYIRRYADECWEQVCYAIPRT